MIFYNVYLQIAIVMKLYSTQCTLGNFDDFFSGPFARWHVKSLATKRIYWLKDQAKRLARGFGAFHLFPLLRETYELIGCQYFDISGRQ